MSKPATPLTLTVQERRILGAWVRASNTPQGVALRAKIVLAAADGISSQQIAKDLGISRPTVLLWRGRFRGAGLKP